MNIWKVIQNGNSLKRTRRDSDGGSIPDDHVTDFHYMDDAKDIWNAVKARFGGNVKSKKMRKSMLKQEFSKFRISEAEGLYKGSQDAGDGREFALMGVTSEENKLGWDDSAFSVFTTNSEDVEGRPIFNRFAKTGSMKAVPPPLSRDYTSLSDHSDLDESQMYYGTKSTTSSESKSVSNDFVSCDDNDKSSKVNTNDFASSDFSVKSLEHKPTDSTSCASTSSVSTSVNEAKIESNAGHFRKNASSVSKLCFVCGSGTHLIKDCDFYEKQMANTTGGLGVGPAVRPQPVPTGKPKVKPVPTGKPKVKTVPTGKPKVTPVPTDGQLLLSPQQVVLGKHIEKVYTGYQRTIVDLIHLHTNDNVADLLTKAFDGPRFNHLVVNIGMLNP
nr:xylulose kinase-1 [Tanacetum cinerariifolium]